ncbi:DNA polymerase III epsilon subunit [Pseudomonas sp. R4-39-08]|nr:DNA polymerase III epsilon subunit [Pseudomonas sp. R4-39-08]
MRRCARPGLFRTPSRSEDLLRAAAIKQRAQKTPVGWQGVCTPKQFRRTCTSVSPFFAMTGRRLGARAAWDKFMHGPKSCGKNPKSRLSDRSHAPRGNAAGDAPRPASPRNTKALRKGDAKRHGMHSHAERGDDHRQLLRLAPPSGASPLPHLLSGVCARQGLFRAPGNRHKSRIRWCYNFMSIFTAPRPSSE